MFGRMLPKSSKKLPVSLQFVTVASTEMESNSSLNSVKKESHEGGPGKGNKRTILFLYCACIYLVIVLCIQLAIIISFNQRCNEQEQELTLLNREEGQHKLEKRQAERAWGAWNRNEGSYCPPGCFRRRRTNPTTTMTTVTETFFYDDWNNGYQRNGLQGPRDRLGRLSAPGTAGSPGSPGSAGLPGSPGSAGLPGSPGSAGLPGSPGSAGLPGSPGSAGLPGSPGSAGLPGSPGSAGLPGSPGSAGLAGSPGSAGLPGSPGSIGLHGSPGSAGLPGSAGSPGSPGYSGRSGAAGPPGRSGKSGKLFGLMGPQESHHSHEHNKFDLKSGVRRKDQGINPSSRNVTGANELLREFKLYSHPKCKDEVDHRELMNTLKDKGKATFIVLVDLQDSEYCIVHA